MAKSLFICSAKRYLNKAEGGESDEWISLISHQLVGGGAMKFEICSASTISFFISPPAHLLIIELVFIT